MDVAQFKLREHGRLLWGDDVSPHFASMLGRIEAAIGTLPEITSAGPTPWPPEPLPSPAVPILPSEPARAGDDLGECGVAALAQGIADGAVTCADIVETLLARAARLQPALAVWAWLDEERARRLAAERDASVRAGAHLGPLHGVPLGIKDIFHVHGMSTNANSRVAPDWDPERDASLAVDRLEGAGAFVLGKTATTEYAYADPSECRNPWSPEHTPGGSSSGSAAGVAARLMPGALGTQTQGSVLRPAAFCGVVGFKPTTERISRHGVLALARSLDHVGTLTRSVADAALLYGVMASARPVPPEERAPRLLILPDALDAHTDDATRTALRGAADALARAGADITLVGRDGDTGPDRRRMLADARAVLESALDVHAIVMAAEVSAYHLGTHGDRVRDLGPRLRATVEAGALVPARALLAAQQLRSSLWSQINSILRPFDATVVPAAPGTAPRGLASTGGPALNGPWSLVGVPAISIPIAVAEDGLPLAMQLVAPYGEDARLLATAYWCERAIGFDARPNL